jgi:hypothetical protein
MSDAESVIARESLFGQRPGEERFAISVEIGRPYKYGAESPTAWVCPVTVEPFFSHALYGEGSLQALCLAVGSVIRELEEFVANGGKLTYEDGEGFLLYAYRSGCL